MTEILIGILKIMAGSAVLSSVGMFIIKRFVKNDRIKQSGWNWGNRTSCWFRIKLGIETWESIEPSLIKMLAVFGNFQIPKGVKFAKIINIFLKDALAVWLLGYKNGLISDNK